MTFQKKKRGHAYCIEWNSDASSDSDELRQPKSLADITINKKSSIFDTPSSCFTTKVPKVQYDESGSESDIEDQEPSKEELMDILQEAHSLMNKKREEFKEL